ncbi:MAG TPA: GAF domain-containing SpoIIE family protein phosphatase, partial [Vicinamibacteria bacterium]|nr:GAF domain-containing SpoIIE family protein phosphatase [Vicinamibacteria bacterium]
ETDPLAEWPEEPRAQTYSPRDLAKSLTPEALSPDEFERQSHVFDILSRVAGALVAHRPLEELVDLVVEELLEVTPASRAALILMEGEPLRPVVKASRQRSGPPIVAVSRAIARKVVGERVSVLIPRVDEDPTFGTRDSITSLGIRSALAAPLWLTTTADGEGDVIGLIYLDSFLEARGFDEDDLRVVTTLANLAATRIHSARLLETTVNRHRLHDDLERAGKIQASLLPSEAPLVDGYALAGEIHSGSTVGADYYDFGNDREHLILALGDVAGRGTGAAILMTLLRAAVRAHWNDGSPGEVMPRINRNLRDSVPPNRYATLFLGRLDPATGCLRYVNAGHHAPILMRAGGEVSRLREGGTVLGVFDEASFGEGVVCLEPGDLLAIFSDGVAEAVDEAEEPFGRQRLLSLLTEHRAKPVPEVMRAVLADLGDYVGGGPVADDWTLIVLKRLSLSPGD